MKLREPLSILIKYNTTETPKIDSINNFNFLRFDYSLVIYDDFAFRFQKRCYSADEAVR